MEKPMKTELRAAMFPIMFPTHEPVNIHLN